jgi:DNA polymerase-3 subunit alpha
MVATMKIRRTPRRKMRIRRTPPARFWSAHTHSRFSNNDALPSVTAIVEKAAAMGQKAVGLTDHGNMAGSVELYQACAKHGIKPFPGSEFYFVPDIEQHKRDHANKNIKASRYHLGILAYTSEGYENLVRLSTQSHYQHFHKPLIDFTTLAEFAEQGRTTGLAVMTGCYFGYLAQTLVNDGEEAAERYLATLTEWFPDSVYVEIQNHEIDHGDGWNDSRLADALVSLADRLGLPVVITQDSHYLDPADKEDHESLKRLVAWGDTPDDAVFPGDGFHLADDRWIADHHGEHRLERGLAGLEHLLSRHSLRIPVLDSYAYSVPRVVANPTEAMEARCLQQLQEMGLPKRYSEKLAEEFDVIRAADMAGYMMLVAMVTDYMTENGIVFQTRGSAAGSLVCWLLGITNVDPIKWDLRFERFLSKDRTKPPDIDLDIAHDRRDEVIAWLDTKFAAHQIGSWATYSMNEKGEDEEDKGSLLRRYFSSARKKGVENFEQIPDADLKMLYRLSDLELYSGMGTNAAGVVLTSTKEEFDRLVPLHHMSRGGYVSQYHKDDIEALGLVKLDVLGSKTLTVLRRTMDNLGLSVEQLGDIEYTDRPTFRLIGSGNTAGIFQLEGGSSKWGCKDLRPNHIKDVIAAMALFRPATMNSGGTKAFIKRKHREEKVPERHELLMKATKDTYGVVLYQEQVIDILRGLGMDADNLTKFLKAVKASNKNIGAAGKVIEGYRAWIKERCDELGMTEEDEEFLDEAIRGFAEYGFNRAHATVYGITAYRCAYLAVHHGLEFHAALLAVAAGDPKKEPNYVTATRSRGIRISKADINASASTYAVDQRRGVIRRGLQAVPGVGATVADAVVDTRATKPFSSVADLVGRVPARPVSGGKEFKAAGTEASLDHLKGVLGKLRDAGALDSLPLRDPKT